MKLFSPDSKFMRFMSVLGDLMLLNFIFLLCSVPVVTIGASVTALYTVVFRMVREKDSRSVVVQFFQSFRQDFRRATLLWLLLLPAGGILALDLWLFSVVTGVMRWLSILFLLLMLLVLFTAGYAFPLLSQFENGVKGTLKNALFLSLGYLPRTLAVTALNLLPFVLLYFNLYLFLYVGFLWIFLYFSAAAYLNARTLEQVFAPFREKKEEEKP
ncbi:MAG: YesL family protein [Oscillospiraceae bacterium]|nr:YesL family protein [Oscillospiraceae bacterium]